MTRTINLLVAFGVILVAFAVMLLTLALPFAALADSANIGVVYGINSHQLRRVIVPDTDDQLTKQKWNGNGEGFLIVPKGANAIQDALDAITKINGIPPPADAENRAAVIAPDGSVESIIVADPDIDTLPGKRLVKVPPYVSALPGTKFDATSGAFTMNGNVITDPLNLPAVPEPIGGL